MPQPPSRRRCSCSCPSRRRPSSSLSSRSSTTAPGSGDTSWRVSASWPPPRRSSRPIAWVFAEPLIDLLFGSEYEAADAWLGPLCLAMALYGLAIVYLYHFLALGRERVAVVLVSLLAAQIGRLRAASMTSLRS